MTDLRRALVNLLRSDVIHVWPAEEIVDLYVLPLVMDAFEGVDEAIREGWPEYRKEHEAHLRARKWAWTERNG